MSDSWISRFLKNPCNIDFQWPNLKKSWTLNIGDTTICVIKQKQDSVNFPLFVVIYFLFWITWDKDLSRSCQMREFLNLSEIYLDVIQGHPLEAKPSTCKFSSKAIYLFSYSSCMPILICLTQKYCDSHVEQINNLYILAKGSFQLIKII